jgi:hypothetical protein
MVDARAANSSTFIREWSFIRQSGIATLVPSSSQVCRLILIYALNKPFIKMQSLHYSCWEKVHID